MYNNPKSMERWNATEVTYYNPSQKFLGSRCIDDDRYGGYGDDAKLVRKRNTCFSDRLAYVSGEVGRSSSSNVGRAATSKTRRTPKLRRVRNQIAKVGYHYRTHFELSAIPSMAERLYAVSDRRQRQTMFALESDPLVPSLGAMAKAYIRRNYTAPHPVRQLRSTTIPDFNSTTYRMSKRYEPTDNMIITWTVRWYATYRIDSNSLRGSIDAYEYEPLEHNATCATYGSFLVPCGGDIYE